MRLSGRAPIGALFLLGAWLAAPAWADGVYRWTDADGRVHFGDRPPPGAEQVAAGRAESGDALRAIDRVLDGDTVHLADGTKVRLIGLNAPEVAHRGDPAEPGGPRARRFLRGFLEGRRVRLTVGPEATDQYDRTLAHVATADGTSVNALLLRKGHAHATIHPPNTERAAAYFAAEAQAREAGRGIWDRPRYRLRPAARAGDLRNSFRRLRGRVERVTAKRKYVYLDFAGDFQAYLAKARAEAFARAGYPPEALRGQTLIVRGWIQLRDGTPAIRLHHPLQIEGNP